MAEGGLVFLRGFAYPGDGFAGDDKKVGRCLGIYITKGDAVFVFML
jgi:hypothetical protein